LFFDHTIDFVVVIDVIGSLIEVVVESLQKPNLFQTEFLLAWFRVVVDHFGFAN
jgi:hypothetical protein